MINLEVADEPPSAAPADLHFVIGTNDAGQWLVVESHGLMGGLFKSRDDAIHYAAFESGRRPGAYELSPAHLSLAFGARRA